MAKKEKEELSLDDVYAQDDNIDSMLSTYETHLFAINEKKCK